MRFQIEASRGYQATGTRWSPGEFRVELAPGEAVTLAASTESWEVIEALDHDEAERAEGHRRRRLIAGLHRFANDPVAAELALAADQFLITPAGRVEETARAHAAGEEVRTVIAGYHWFTDWGRDTMISLEGLTLSTGRLDEARFILRTFAYYIRDGLIPNMFPEGEKGASTTRPTPRSGSSTPSAATSPPPTTATPSAYSSPSYSTSSTTTSGGRGSASALTRPTACSARGRRAISSPGWTPRLTAGL